MGSAAEDNLRRVTANFAELTAVERIADGQYSAQIAKGWDIAGVSNGGFVLAIAARAMAESVGRPPLAVTAHYLSPTHPGPCSVQVKPPRIGKRLAVLSGSLVQDGREAFRVLGTFGESSGASPRLSTGNLRNCRRTRTASSFRPPRRRGWRSMTSWPSAGGPAMTGSPAVSRPAAPR